MKTAASCIPCFVRQAAEALAMADPDGARTEPVFRMLLRDIAGADWSAVPVTMTQRMQRTIRRELGCADPYRELKQRMNRIALGLLPELRNAIRNRPDPRDASVRVAIAGNLLDAGSKTRLNPHELPARLRTIWDVPLSGSAADLFHAAEKAERILYLADNAGEIVLDRLLIEALPSDRITVAVRGQPVINDATREDADAAGLTGFVRVITNGSDAPGTLLAECSAEFRDCFDRADLVIAKGQGNFETLSDSTKNLFFLLTVKCPLIAAEIGAPIGALVVSRGQASRSL